jgi:2'-5' RNA ligase
MSPPPEYFTNRWRDGRGAANPEHGILYWHLLLGRNPQLRHAARAAQRRLANFSGLHVTPFQWLHLTVLISGEASQVSESARSEMLRIAEAALSETGPISIKLDRILYHPEAIVLAADPAEALHPLREAAHKATQAIMGHHGAANTHQWVPHVTLCYSTTTQRAEPIIAALGKKLPDCRAKIDTLSLVIQQGSEWLWNWTPVGAVSLPASPTTR